MYFTLDIIPLAGDDWDDFGEEFASIGDAIDTACALLCEGYAVRLVEHGDD